METLWQDVRYGWRMLVRHPGFTLVAITALALGIGANTAIFSVVDEVLLRPLPFREPERLVMVWEHNRPRSREMNVISPANFLDWRDQNSVFEEMAMFFDLRFNLTGVDDPEELAAQAVTVNLFPLLGAGPARGRLFAAGDGQEGTNVTILSDGLWRRRFGADPSIVGKTVLLSGRPYTIIGVMPPGFQFFVKQASFGGKQAEMWMPFEFTPNHRVRRGRFPAAIARLKPGVALSAAQAELDTIAGRLETQYPDFNTGWGVRLVPLHRQMTGEISRALLVLFAAVGCVLLICCVNVANLLLARASAREKEIALRAALGAGRGRIIRQLLTESVLLAGAGGLLGLFVAQWGVDALLALSPPELLQVRESGIDYRVFGFTLTVSLLTGLLFGLVPALIASRPHLNEALKEGGRSGGGAKGRRLRGALVVVEVALALVLLAGAGLMIRSLLRLQSVDPGFNAQNLLTARVLLPGSKYGRDEQRIAFFRDLLARVRALPGVRAASANAFPPFAGPGSATGFEVVGRPKPPAGQGPVCDVRVIDPDYFRTMGIPLLRGRTFNEREATQPSHVVVVNETLAREQFPGQDPLGQRITIAMKDENVPSEIIGVVGDIRHASLETPGRAMVYWPHPELAFPFMSLLIRTDVDPLTLTGAVQREVKALDRDQPVADVRTMEQLLAASIARTRFATLLLGIFSALALLLAAVGIYGVMSYSVAQRTHELGIRLALGARSSDLTRLVVTQGLKLASLGLGLGLLGALAVTRLLSGLLYGVTASDPLTYLAIAGLLLVVALLACWVPARRAARTDPMIALRSE